ncbi:hypothetical protein TSUD_36600 [Trifolium subterraneum]|uniref:Uncharacterized protein n=1 Tax=Trifolium subterraneum TaxID=3900 RepID=A0A2Z6NJ15_TRISU|nr:hypothetical protein TSUD_36600 [Trifolium subterraneum]
MLMDLRNVFHKCALWVSKSTTFFKHLDRTHRIRIHLNSTKTTIPSQLKNMKDPQSYDSSTDIERKTAENSNTKLLFGSRKTPPHAALEPCSITYPSGLSATRPSLGYNHSIPSIPYPFGFYSKDHTESLCFFVGTVE